MDVSTQIPSSSKLLELTSPLNNHLFKIPYSINYVTITLTLFPDELHIRTKLVPILVDFQTQLGTWAPMKMLTEHQLI